MNVPDPKANTTTEAYLAYKAGYLEESELKPVLYEPYLHFDAWLAYWGGLTETYPTDKNGDPEMLCDEEALVAYLAGVTDTYPEDIKDPYDVRIVGYLKYLVSARFGRPEYPVNNEEFYLSTMDAPHTSNETPSADIELDTSEGKLIDVKAYGDTFQQTYTGKNLFNYTDTSNLSPFVTLGDDGWVTMTYDNSAGSSTVYVQYYTYALPLTINTNYNVVLEVKSVSGTGSIAPVTAHVSAQFTADWSNSFASLANNTIHTHISTTKSDFTDATHSLRTLGVFAAGQSGTIVFRLSLLADTSVTPQTFVYQPYVGGTPAPNPDYPQDIQLVTGEQTVTISDGVNSHDYTVALGSLELCKIGTYQDYIYKSGDDWYVHKATGKVVLDGSENWTSRTDTYNVLQMDVVATTDNIASGTQLCNYAIYNSAVFNYGRVGQFAILTNTKHIIIGVPDGTTVASFQTMLSTNNLVAYYPLATPTDTQITDSTLISQLDTLAGADTYNEKTYIKVTTADPNLPALLKVEAYKY